MIFIKDEFSTEYFQIISTAQLRANTKKLAQKLFPLTIIEKHHNKFICEICKKKYSYEKSLVNHIDRH